MFNSPDISSPFKLKVAKLTSKPSVANFGKFQAF